jgi:hypothetical protein
MRLGIVACEAFKGEIERLTAGDPDVVFKEYLEFGLHTNPENMKKVIIEKVNGLEEKVDSVFLGYGYCQSLTNVTSQLRIPTAMLETDDCIAVLLTPSEYESERKKCAGTWYNTPFFAEAGKARLIKELHLDSPRPRKYDEMWFMRKFFEGYSRCLYIDTDIGEREKYERASKAFAEELKLRHESRDGTLSILKEGINRAKKLASSKNQKA